MNAIFSKTRNGVTWVGRQDDKYLVTGIDRNGKKFRLIFGNWMHANAINLYRGNKWLLRGSKRYLITRIFN